MHGHIAGTGLGVPRCPALRVLDHQVAVERHRADLLERLQQPDFLASLVAALATGALAGLAAFMISIPGRSAAWILLPLPALAAWISTIGYGCIADWISIGPEGMQWGETARCFATVLLTSLPLGLALLIMLRHAALLRARAVAVTGGVAVAVASEAGGLPGTDDVFTKFDVLVNSIATALAGQAGGKK